MTHATAILACLACLSLWPDAAPAQDQGKAQSATESNTGSNTGGTLTPIWRNEPVIGIWLSSGQGLIDVPDYLDGTDFPYVHRPYPREVPFADRLTVVRLLGGWDKRDLGKGESRDYDTIAQGDLVTRPFGAPTLRTTDLVDLGPLTCDRQAGRCSGRLEWEMPDDGLGDPHLLITAGDRLHICAGAEGTQDIDWFRIGVQYTITVQEVESCSARTANDRAIGTLTVDPSQLDYHFDLMKRRLDPYLAQGYTDLTLVLDNIPWALPHDPTTGTYGQTAPPSSLAEWSDFVDRLVAALIADYGAETVAGFRFRLGTEQQSGRRFSGTPRQYLELYEATVKAIHARLPEARIGPFNQAGSNDDPTALTYAFLYANIADPGDIDFIAHSLYYLPKREKGVLTNAYTAQRLPDYEALWRNLPRAPGTTVEFQEFGVLRNQDGLASGEPGARGAALHVSDIFSMLAAGVDGLWHWQPFERLTVRGLGIDTQVLSGRGWLYLVLDRFVGGQIYPLSWTAPQAPDTTFTAHFIDTGTQDLILVSAFNPDQARDSTDPMRVTVEIPKELIPNPSAVRFEQVSLSQRTAVYDRIRADLDREGLLKKDFATAPGQPVAGIMAMGGAAGRRYVAQHWDGYRDAIIQSLKTRPVTPDITAGPDAYRLTLDIPAPSVLALVVSGR